MNDYHLLPRFRDPLDPAWRRRGATDGASSQTVRVVEPVYSSKLPGDTYALRGIPAIGRGVSGAIAGTVPHAFYE